MDIIAAHQLGLIEQLEVEATALAGGGREAVQRAITCHHVADLLGRSHAYALLAAQGALALDAALARLDRAARRPRWRWGAGEARRAALAQRAARFGETLRQLDAERCAGLLMAYRLVATPGLAAEAARRLDPAMLESLTAAQAARGGADVALRRALFEAHRLWAADLVGSRVEAAVAALEWARGPGVAAAVEAVLIPKRSLDRAERRGLARVEAGLRRSKRLPAGFAANPAQAFFRLQRQIAERRRRAADGDQLPADEAVRLAA